MTAPLNLDALQALCDAATPGPWHTSGPDSIAQWMIHDADWCIAEATHYTTDRAYGAKRGPGYIDADTNAAFISAAREAVPALIQEVRRLQRREQELVGDYEAAALTLKRMVQHCGLNADSCCEEWDTPIGSLGLILAENYLRLRDKP